MAKRIEVTEVEGVFPPPEERLYEFTVTDLVHGPDEFDRGFRVGARGPRGCIETTVYGDVTAETVIGAKFFRS